MILVAGSTGNLGSKIVRQLRERDKPVRALVRKTSDPAKVDRLKELGATVVEGDLTEPTSLDSVCRGIETVITTVTTTLSQTPGDTIPSVDHDGQLNLVQAAEKAGVSRYIYLSFSPVMGPDTPLTIAKRTLEQRVTNSGMTYTIVRPSYFMDIWLSPIVGFDYPNGKATLYGNGKNPISWISSVDVARFVAMAVDSPAARNTIVALGGPDKLTPNDVVAIFEERAGKPFAVEYVPEAALETQRMGSDDPLQKSFAGLMLSYANGDPIDMEQTLQQFPVRLTSVQEYAEHVMATLASSAVSAG